MTAKPPMTHHGRKIPVVSYYDPDTKILSHQTVIPHEDGSGRAAWSNILGARHPELLVEIMQDEDGEDIGILPTRGGPTDAGLDLYAAEDVTLWGIKSQGPAGPDAGDVHRATISTGIKVQIPPGLCLLLWDRSGLSAKHGVHRVAGVIDDTYRGELKVALVNLSHSSYDIKKGDRIAQAILTPMILPVVKRVNSVDNNTTRGEGGFGSTGR